MDIADLVLNRIQSRLHHIFLNTKRLIKEFLREEDVMINYFDKSDALENAHFRDVLTVASDSIADEKRHFSVFIFSILFPG